MSLYTPLHKLLTDMEFKHCERGGGDGFMYWHDQFEVFRIFTCTFHKQWTIEGSEQWFDNYMKAGNKKEIRKILNQTEVKPLLRSSKIDEILK